MFPFRVTHVNKKVRPRTTPSKIHKDRHVTGIALCIVSFLPFSLLNNCELYFALLKRSQCERLLLRFKTSGQVFELHLGGNWGDRTDIGLTAIELHAPVIGKCDSCYFWTY